MTELKHTDRVAALERHIEEGTLIRHWWTGEDERGRATACLLAALSPEAAEAEDAIECPAGVMPAWLARMTPRIDDGGTADAWSSMVRRYARCARGWHTLDDAAWRRVLGHTMLECLVGDAPETEAVRALWRRAIAGDEPDKEEWQAAAASDASCAAAAASDAAYAVAAVYAAAAAAAAADAAWAADARAAYAAARAAYAAASAAAAPRRKQDEITDACLSAIEMEIKND